MTILLGLVVFIICFIAIVKLIFGEPPELKEPEEVKPQTYPGERRIRESLERLENQSRINEKL